MLTECPLKRSRILDPQKQRLWLLVRWWHELLDGRRT